MTFPSADLVQIIGHLVHYLALDSFPLTVFLKNVKNYSECFFIQAELSVFPRCVHFSIITRKAFHVRFVVMSVGPCSIKSVKLFLLGIMWEIPRQKQTDISSVHMLWYCMAHFPRHKKWPRPSTQESPWVRKMHTCAYTYINKYVQMFMHCFCSYCMDTSIPDFQNVMLWNLRCFTITLILQ